MLSTMHVCWCPLKSHVCSHPPIEHNATGTDLAPAVRSPVHPIRLPPRNVQAAARALQLARCRGGVAWRKVKLLQKGQGSCGHAGKGYSWREEERRSATPSSGSSGGGRQLALATPWTGTQTTDAQRACAVRTPRRRSPRLFSTTRAIEKERSSGKSRAALRCLAATSG